MSRCSSQKDSRKMITHTSPPTLSWRQWFRLCSLKCPFLPMVQPWLVSFPSHCSSVSRDGGFVSSSVNPRQIQGYLAVLIFRGDLGAGLRHQPLDHFQMGFGSQKQLDHFQMAVLCRVMHRRPHLILSLVDDQADLMI